MLLFESKQRALLWFPDLGPSDDFFAEPQLFLEAFDAEKPFDSHFECSVYCDEKQTRLLFRNPEVAVREVDLVWLKSVHQTRTMSCNDLISYCTSTKIAKGGYYEVGTPKLNR
jgi:hypothetical protein